MSGKTKWALNVHDFHKFAIEWQRVTGRLLMTQERTREVGKEKMRDADERQEIFDTMVNEGLL